VKIISRKGAKIFKSAALFESPACALTSMPLTGCPALSIIFAPLRETKLPDITAKMDLAGTRSYIGSIIAGKAIP
jgi:hypothetical protein